MAVAFDSLPEPCNIRSNIAPSQDSARTGEYEPNVESHMYSFPFSVPEDLNSLSLDELSALDAQVVTFANGLLTKDAPEAEAVTATNELITGIRDLSNAHKAAIADRERLAELTNVEEEPEEESESDDSEEESDEPVEDVSDVETEEAAEEVSAVTASAQTPRVRDVATGETPDLPAIPEHRPYASMVAAADLGGHGPLTSFADAANVIEQRLSTHSPAPLREVSTSNPDHVKLNRLPMSKGYGELHFPENARRYSAIKFKRDFPTELVANGSASDYDVLLHAADEHRLPGGNLVKSASTALKDGRSLTAAAGWCAPSETIYDLCELESLDGILDVPEIQASRGGLNVPEDGGPDFASIFDLFTIADNFRTEAQVIAETPPKVCVEIPCPPFEDNRLDVAYICLTGSLLQRRGYPEAVARFSRGAMVALAHRINQQVIADIVTGSGAANVVPAVAYNDDSISAVLSAVDLAIVDAKYRNRMSFSSTLEVVLPMWVLQALRAAAARRRGVDMISTSDAEIMAWFAVRDAVPRFVYDWQDAATGLATGPGGATPLLTLPDTVDFLVYPAGAWAKAVQDVVSLDTIYDSTLLTTNQYTALFAEDGFATIQTCPLSRLYTASVAEANFLQGQSTVVA